MVQFIPSHIQRKLLIFRQSRDRILWPKVSAFASSEAEFAEFTNRVRQPPRLITSELPISMFAAAAAELARNVTALDKSANYPPGMANEQHSTTYKLEIRRLYGE